MRKGNVHKRKSAIVWLKNEQYDDNQYAWRTRLVLIWNEADGGRN